MDDIDDDIDNPQGNYLCPSCGVMPDIQGPTLGCTDLEGCSTISYADSEEEDSSDDYEDEDDMGLEELDF